MDNPPLMGTVQSGVQGTAVPLAGALVTLYDATEAEPKLVASATADRDGHFVMDPAPAPSAQGVYYAMPAPKGGGWYSPVDIGLLHRLVRERPDQTTEEVTRAYNRRVAPEVRVHRSSILPGAAADGVCI